MRKDNQLFGIEQEEKLICWQIFQDFRVINILCCNSFPQTGASLVRVPDALLS
jgi:hypothetical protein